MLLLYQIFGWVMLNEYFIGENKFVDEKVASQCYKNNSDTYDLKNSTLENRAKRDTKYFISDQYDKDKNKVYDEWEDGTYYCAERYPVYYPFTEYHLESLEIRYFLLGAASAYISLLAFSLFRRHKNLGWKRLSLVISIIPMPFVGYVMFRYLSIEYTSHSLWDPRDGQVGGWDHFDIALSSLVAYPVSIILFLMASKVFDWISDGFKKSG